ncbi:hypothetical protein IMZ48_40390 [Candidatus Bathyarchaeota archaeon]|nr:hypothetical protein [Candidatus Bathyarchaeota archaeon]
MDGAEEALLKRLQLVMEERGFLEASTTGGGREPGSFGEGEEIEWSSEGDEGGSAKKRKKG